MLAGTGWRGRLHECLNRRTFLGTRALGTHLPFAGVDVLGKLKEIEKAPFRSPEEIREKQFQDLCALLAHAEARVPYYRTMFRRVGIRSQDIRTWGDFAHLPILTKDIIRENQRELVREDVSVEKLSPHFSGGSTGVPLKFFRSSEYMVASDAGNYRNLEQCGWRPGEMIAFFWGGNDKLYAMSRGIRAAAVRTAPVPVRSVSFGRGRYGDLGTHLCQDQTVRHSGVCLDYRAFCPVSGEQRTDDRRIRGVFTTAEKMYRPQRELIERAFGCKVFHCYGSSEVQNIAAECPQGRMHINSDAVVIEEDKADGDAPRPLLLTSLQNLSMLFIRCRNEDCGYLSHETCSCGNNFPLMRLGIARTGDNFLFPGGRVVHGEFFTHLMYGTDAVANFQFHQTAIDKIVLRIVPARGDARRRDETIQQSIRQIQAVAPVHPVRVEVQEVESIPLSSAGKHRFTRSDVNAEGLVDRDAATSNS